MDIKQIIDDSFDSALIKPVAETTELKINRQRSINWVESLADTFRKVNQKKDNIRVFSKYHDENRKDFGVNELLYDISVCKINYTESPKNKTKLGYIEKALWLIESEMAKDTRQLVYDFNKLVIGDAENKLFVGPSSEEIEKFIPKLGTIARNCNGFLYLCLIPHPEKWGTGSNKPKVWKFNGEEFINLEQISL